MSCKIIPAYCNSYPDEKNESTSRLVGVRKGCFANLIQYVGINHIQKDIDVIPLTSTVNGEGLFEWDNQMVTCVEENKKNRRQDMAAPKLTLLLA